MGKSPRWSTVVLAYLGYIATNIGALIIRIGFWGPLYFHHNKEPPKCIGNYLGPYIMLHSSYIKLSALEAGIPESKAVKAWGLGPRGQVGLRV